jgi:hypothetical protein
MQPVYDTSFEGKNQGFFEVMFGHSYPGTGSLPVAVGIMQLPAAGCNVNPPPQTNRGWNTSCFESIPEGIYPFIW